MLDGEIVCLGPDGNSRFYDLLFRRDWPSFAAFDLLELHGENLRKRRLREVLPAHNRGCSTSIMCGAEASICSGRCVRETAKASWRSGHAAATRTDGCSTSWLKIKNPDYSKMAGRRERFEQRREARQSNRCRWRAPVLRLGEYTLTL